MATEVAQLLVRLEARVDGLSRDLDKGLAKINSFSTRSTKSFSKVGRSVRRMLTRFTGIGTALAGIASIAGFGALVRGAIDAASAIDTFQIRLTNVLGSVERANGLIDDLAGFATKVAPSFEDIVAAASTLGTVALGASTKVQRLTETATNIAAVTGLSLPQAASNLQRTLAQGIGAADLFRERGVRAIVEAVTGIPNLIAQPLSVVEEAFNQTFGPDGVFGGAAEQFATTLPGAISVTGDALFQFRAALGEAASPSIITFLDIIIRGFNSFRDTIKKNNTEVDQFVRVGLKLLITGLTGIGEIVILAIKGFLRFVPVFAAIKAEFAAMQFVIVQGLNLIGLASDATVEAARSVADEAVQKVVETNEQVNILNSGLDTLADKLRKVRAESQATDFGQAAVDRQEAARDPAAEAGLRAAFEQARPLDAKATAATNSALTKTVGILQQIGVESAKSQDKLLGDIAKIDVQVQKLNAARSAVEATVVAREAQIAALTKEIEALDKGEEKTSLIERKNNSIVELRREQAELAATQARIDVGLDDLAARRLDKAQRFATATGQVPTLLAQARTVIDQVAAKDAEKAIRLREQLDAIDLQNTALEDQVTQIGKVVTAGEKRLRQLSKEAADELAGDLLGPFQNAIGQGLRGAISGEGVDFAESLANISGELLTNSLGKVFEGLKDDLSGLLEGLNLGEGFGAAIGAGLGLAGGIISKALQETTTDVTNDLVDSAVDQSREIRGIVAGPTDIPIAKVGDTIRDSFVPIRALLARLVQIGEADLALKGGGVPGTSSGTQATPNTTNPLNTAPILA